MNKKTKPNILLIQVDQCSAESLGIFGNPLVRTPALESLAAQGAVFQNAYCNYPACAPSRSSMLTGRYCSTLNIHANHMLLNPREITLTHLLKEAGYYTALIGKNHAYEDGKRGTSDELHRVFDHVIEGGHNGMVEGYENDPEVKAAAHWAVEHCWKPPIPYGVNPARKEKMGTWILGDETIKFLNERARDSTDSQDSSFFLWLSFPDPHTPYQTCEPYASLYDHSLIPLPPKDDYFTKTERQRVAYEMDAMDTASDDHMKHVRATHYGMINMIDDTLARVFKTLEETGLRENTLIVFTSDHGDSMGAHGFVQKLNMFYDSFTRVPLIFSWPGHIAISKQTKPAELVDLMPTLLEFAGLEIPFGVQGKSMASCLLEERETVKDFIVIESGEEGCHPRVCDLPFRPKDVWDGSHFVWCAYREAWFGRGRSIRQGDWKLNIYADEQGELYNLKEDPCELNNLISDDNYRERIIDLKEKLLYWMLDHLDSLPENDTVKLNFKTGS